MMSFEQHIEERLYARSTCPICGRSRLNVIGKTATIHTGSRVKVDLVECVACSHWFIRPVVAQDELSRLYENGSEYVVSDGWQPAKEMFNIPEKHIIRHASQNVIKGKRYLEIGVGRGLLLSHFRDAGCECYGVEPGPWAQDMLGVVSCMGELDQADFDMVAMVDVLEHTEDPLAVVRSVSSLIRSGTLYACFPNNQSLRAKLAKVDWRMVRPFGHLHFFSKQSLRIMFESTGFRVTYMRKTDLLDFRWRRVVWPPQKCPAYLLMLLTQSVWGDQWIVRAEKEV